jgi:hypothetical protein
VTTGEGLEVVPAGDGAGTTPRLVIISSPQ